MTHQNFINKWDGKACDWDKYFGYQCVDLAHQYAVEVNERDIPNAPAAKDLWKKDIPGYTKIANTPTNVPQQGDIIIWGTEVGAYGHIAIFDHGDASSFVSFDQNWPVNSVCHLQNHSYKGVLGWLRPLKPRETVMYTAPISSANTAQQTVQYTTDPNSLLTDQSKISLLGGEEIGAIRSKIIDLTRENLQLVDQLQKIRVDLAESNTKLRECQNKPLPATTQPTALHELIRRLVGLWQKN